MKEIISDILLSLGFARCNLGYNYVFELILLGVNVNIFPLKYNGYQYLSKKYNKSVDSIDKSIQNAISNAWTYGNVEEQFRFFGETIRDSEGKPSNKQFILTIISTILDKIS